MARKWHGAADEKQHREPVKGNSPPAFLFGHCACGGEVMQTAFLR